MLAVHLRINDSTTKKPTPVRLSITGPNGEYYPPLGRLAAFACGVGEDVGGNLRVGRENFAYIDGSCEVRLPAGVPLRIRATKGLEYAPIDHSITLGSGQMAVRLEIARHPHFRPDEWMSGDARSHFLSPHAARLETTAEGLDVVNVLAKSHHRLANDGNTHLAIPNLIEFSGQSPALDGEPFVVVNTFNAHPVLGNLSLLNSHRPIFPLAFGEPYDSDDWSLFDWSNQCHRKNGLVVWSEPFQPDGGESLVAAILGKVDAFELTASPRSPVLPWYYRLLNAGVRLPLVGASGKDSNRVPLGAMRTYARIGDQPRAYASWIEAVRAGNTYVTNGPSLHWTIGETIETWSVASSPFERFECVADGEVFDSVGPHEIEGRSVAELKIAKPSASWIAFRCVGGASPFDPDATQFAHSSPVYLKSSKCNPVAAKSLLAQIDRLREWAIERANFTDEKWRAQLLSNCDLAAARLT